MTVYCNKRHFNIFQLTPIFIKRSHQTVNCCWINNTFVAIENIIKNTYFLLPLKL